MLHQQLRMAGIDAIAVPGPGVVYGQRKPGMPPLYVVNRQGYDKRVVPMDEATGIFERYQDERCVGRLYVDKPHRAAARAVIDKA
jgi:hypothetical protein